MNYVSISKKSKEFGFHIGTIQIENNTDFNIKLKIALESYFNAVVQFDDQSLVNLIYGNIVEFNIDYQYEDDADEKNSEIIEMFLTNLI